jgi:PUA domain
MKKFQVDRGAIKFVLSGANIMCPGLTSPGGALDEEVLENRPVVTFLVPSKDRIFGDFYEIVLFFEVLVLSTMKPVASGLTNKNELKYHK